MVHWSFTLGTALVAASASANPVARRGRGEAPPAVPPLGDPVVIPGAYIAELADEVGFQLDGTKRCPLARG